jgi:hypothetical protein
MPEQDVEVNLAEPKHSEGRSLAVGLISLLFILPAKRVHRIYGYQRFAAADRRGRSCRGSPIT